jgi:hypothetical protein
MYVASTQFGLVCMYVRMYVGCGSSFWGTVDGRNLPQSADLTARRSWLANNGWFGLCVEQVCTYGHGHICNFDGAMVDGTSFRMGEPQMRPATTEYQLVVWWYCRLATNAAKPSTYYLAT